LRDSTNTFKRFVVKLGVDIFNIQSYFVITIKKFVADYQAKLGNFLLLKQKLYVAQDRLAKLPQTLDSTALSADINTALATQENLEIGGFAVIDVLNKIQKDPVIQDALKGNYPGSFEFEKWALLQNTLNNVNQVAGTAQVFFGKVFTQQKNVEDIEKRIVSLETGKPISSGFQWNLSNIPTPVITVGLAVLFFGFKIFWTVRKSPRRAR